MDEREISCLYYPTTVVVVDDNEAVLENIQITISPYTLCKTFLSPQEALQFLQNETKKNEFEKSLIGVDEDSENYSYLSNQLPIKYDLPKIFQRVYSKDRFSEVSVLVVDYTMPGMNGEELCKKLERPKGNPLKIIMLTGDADEPMAVRLFNEGVIDRFLRKDQPNIDEELKNCIISMQKRYFQDLTYPILRGIVSESDSSLEDPIFIEFFNKTLSDISASSYYLIDPSGSFIFLNNEGTPTWLIIKTLNELEEISQQIEADISEELVDSIKNGDYVPYFGGSEMECYSNEEKLKSCLHKAHKLEGNKSYRYALLDELPEFSFERDKVMSFNQYVSSL